MGGLAERIRATHAQRLREGKEIIKDAAVGNGSDFGSEISLKAFLQLETAKARTELAEMREESVTDNGVDLVEVLDSYLQPNESEKYNGVPVRLNSHDFEITDAGRYGAEAQIFDIQNNNPNNGIPTKENELVLRRHLVGLRVNDPNYMKNILTFFDRVGKAGTLKHDRTATVYGSGLEIRDGAVYPFIVMEKIDGPTVSEHIKPETSIETTLDVTEQTLETLVSVHKQGIVHRDVKPSNLIDNGDGEIEVHLTDFGLAREIPDGTFTGTFDVGTPSYAAPEQINLGKSSPKADVYSTGLITAELILGSVIERVGRGENYKSVNRGRLEEALVQGKGLESKVASKIVDFVMNSVDPDPEKRFDSKQALTAVRYCRDVLEGKVELEKTEQGPVSLVPPLPFEVPTPFDDQDTVQGSTPETVQLPVKEARFTDFYDGLYGDDIERIKTVLKQVGLDERLIENPYDITHPGIISKIEEVEPVPYSGEDYPEGQQTPDFVSKHFERRGLTSKNIKARNSLERKLRREIRKGVGRQEKRSFQYQFETSRGSPTIEACEYLQSTSLVPFPDGQGKDKLYDLLSRIGCSVHLSKKDREAVEVLPLTTETVSDIKEHIDKRVGYLATVEPKHNLVKSVSVEFLSDNELKVLKRDVGVYSRKWDLLKSTGATVLPWLGTYYENPHLITFCAAASAFIGLFLTYEVSKHTFRYKRQVLDKADVLLKEHVRKIGHRPDFMDVLRIEDRVHVDTPVEVELKNSDTSFKDFLYFVNHLPEAVGVTVKRIANTVLCYGIGQVRYLTERGKRKQIESRRLQRVTFPDLADKVLEKIHESGFGKDYSLLIKASDLCKEVIEKAEHDHPELHLYKGLSLFLYGNLAGADHEFKKATDLGHLVEGFSNSGLTSLIGSSQHASRMDLIYAASFAAERIGQKNGSLDARRFDILIRTYLGDYDRALEEVGDAEHFVMSGTEAGLIRAAIYLRQKKVPKAFEELNYTINNHNIGEDSALLSATYFARGMAVLEDSIGRSGLDLVKVLDKAISDFEESVRLSEFQEAKFNVHLCRGLQYKLKGNLKKARKELAKAMKLPDSVTSAYLSPYHHELGEMCMIEGDVDQAFVELKRALKFGGDVEVINRSLGSVLTQKGEFDEAEKHLKRAIEQNPEDAISYLLLGSVSNLKGDFQSGIENSWIALTKGLESEFEAVAYNNFGRAMNCLGNYEQALDVLISAKKISESTGERILTIYANMGDSYAGLGKKLEAIGSYSSVISELKMRKPKGNLRLNDYVAGARAEKGLKNLGVDDNFKYRDQGLNFGILKKEHLDKE